MIFQTRVLFNAVTISHYIAINLCLWGYSLELLYAHKTILPGTILNSSSEWCLTKMLVPTAGSVFCCCEWLLENSCGFGFFVVFFFLVELNSSITMHHCRNMPRTLNKVKTSMFSYFFNSQTHIAIFTEIISCFQTKLSLISKYQKNQNIKHIITDELQLPIKTFFWLRLFFSTLLLFMLCICQILNWFTVFWNLNWRRYSIG